MKIEMLIDELQEIVDEAFTLPLSGGKTVVNTERLKEIIDDMRTNLPIEIKQAKSIAADRTNILTRSRDEAERIVQEAEERSKLMIKQADDRAKSMVANSEIVAQANRRADQIIANAKNQAGEMTGAAYKYMDDLMKKADEELSKNLEAVKKTRQSLKNFQNNPKGKK